MVSAFTPFWNVMGQKLAVEPDVQRADAVVVLCSGVNGDGTLSDESLRRAARGMEIYKSGLASWIVMSGPAIGNNTGRTEASIRRDLAVRMGIPDDRIIVISDVQNTRDESRHVAAALAARHATSIVLVTEALHMRRAALVFARTGLTVFPAPSDNQPQAAYFPDDRLMLMRTVLEQGSALLYYRLAGYI